LPADITYDSAVGPSLLLAQRSGTHLPANLRDPALPPHTFRAGLKTLLLSSY